MDNPAQESSTTTQPAIPAGPLTTEDARSVFAAILDTPAEAPGEPQEPPRGPDGRFLPTRAAEAPADDPGASEPAQAAEGEPPAADAQEDDPVVTVKVDGQDVQVKLSELKLGYQRQADYTRKTMAVAEEKRAAQSEAEKARAERAQYLAGLTKAQAAIEAALAQQNQTTNWEQLLTENPTEYLKQRHLAEQRQAQLQQVLGERQRVDSQLQAEAAEAYQRHIAEQQQDLLAKLPEWKDESRAKADRVAIREYLLEQGYDKKALESIANARDVILARKAMLYDQMVAKAQAATKKVATLPSKALLPGNGERAALSRSEAAMRQLGKSGRVEDAAAVFASLL